MADDLTVEQTIKELRRIIPDLWARAVVHLHSEMNRPDFVLKTVNSAEIYIEGGYFFRGSTLNECMAQVREWKQSQHS